MFDLDGHIGSTQSNLQYSDSFVGTKIANAIDLTAIILARRPSTFRGPGGSGRHFAAIFNPTPESNKWLANSVETCECNRPISVVVLNAKTALYTP